MKLSSAIVWFSVCGSTIVYAHDDDRSNPNWLAASASITYREYRVVEDNEAYLIPGIMLGGEAIPPQEGIQYDDLTFQFTKAFGSSALSDVYRISGKLGIHQGHDNQLELDNLWFTLPLFSEKKQVIELVIDIQIFDKVGLECRHLRIRIAHVLLPDIFTQKGNL